MPALGALLCLASATAFGAMGIFGTLAYDEGATLGTLLAVRFSLAAALFWVVAACTGATRGLRTLTRRDLAIAVALGAVIYSAQAGAYFAGLQRIDVSLLSLLLYTFPAIVTVAAIVLGRERPSARRFAALGLASAGLVLVVAGAGTGRWTRWVRCSASRPRSSSAPTSSARPRSAAGSTRCCSARWSAPARRPRCRS